MADSIVNLNSYRRATAKDAPANDCGKVRTSARKNAAVRKTRNKQVAPVLQIPTEANKAQRCAAASKRYKKDCEDRLVKGLVHATKNPITGVMILSATDEDGGDFKFDFEGIYWENAEAALSTLGCLVEHFQERAQDERNARAMAAAQPVKRPAFEVAL